MTDLADLGKRLRSDAKWYRVAFERPAQDHEAFWETGDLLNEAADAIESLAKEVDYLRAKLKQAA